MVFSTGAGEGAVPSAGAGVVAAGAVAVAADWSAEADADFFSITIRVGRTLPVLDA